MTACIVCHRDLQPTERQTCLRCLAEVRRLLATVERLYGLLPSMLGHLPGGGLDSIMGRGNDEATLPGGDVIVMLGPGSASHVGHPADPPAVAFELGTWVEDWSELRRESVRLSVSVPAKVAWLSARAGWAAEQHVAFAYFASDVRWMVARLEDATDTSERPERGVSCPYCGEALERWAMPRTKTSLGGYPDEWACKGCELAFSPGQYGLAVAAAREAEHGGS